MITNNLPTVQLYDIVSAAFNSQYIFQAIQKVLEVAKKQGVLPNNSLTNQPCSAIDIITYIKKELNYNPKLEISSPEHPVGHTYISYTQTANAVNPVNVGLYPNGDLPWGFSDVTGIGAHGVVKFDYFNLNPLVGFLTKFGIPESCCYSAKNLSIDDDFYVFKSTGVFNISDAQAKLLTQIVNKEIAHPTEWSLINGSTCTNWAINILAKASIIPHSFLQTSPSEKVDIVTNSILAEGYTAKNIAQGVFLSGAYYIQLGVNLGQNLIGRSPIMATDWHEEVASALSINEKSVVNAYNVANQGATDSQSSGVGIADMAIFLAKAYKEFKPEADKVFAKIDSILKEKGLDVAGTIDSFTKVSESYVKIVNIGSDSSVKFVDDSFIKYLTSFGVAENDILELKDLVTTVDDKMHKTLPLYEKIYSLIHNMSEFTQLKNIGLIDFVFEKVDIVKFAEDPHSYDQLFNAISSYNSSSHSGTSKVEAFISSGLYDETKGYSLSSVDFTNLQKEAELFIKAKDAGAGSHIVSSDYASWAQKIVGYDLDGNPVYEMYKALFHDGKVIGTFGGTVSDLNTGSLLSSDFVNTNFVGSSNDNSVNLSQGDSYTDAGGKNSIGFYGTSLDLTGVEGVNGILASAKSNEALDVTTNSNAINNLQVYGGSYSDITLRGESVSLGGSLGSNSNVYISSEVVSRGELKVNDSQITIYSNAAIQEIKGDNNFVNLVTSVPTGKEGSFDGQITLNGDNNQLLSVGEIKAVVGDNNKIDATTNGNNYLEGGDGNIVNFGSGSNLIDLGSKSKVKVGDGDNIISTQDGSSIVAGDGNNDVDIYSSSVSSDVTTINVGKGDNNINIQDNSSVIRTGDGNQDVNIMLHRKGVVLPESLSTKIVTGAGDDKINVGSEILNNTDINVGEGNNQISIYDYHLGDSPDKVDIVALSGDDSVKISLYNSSTTANIDLGSGQNAISGSFNNSNIITGDGLDFVNVSGDNLSIKTGAGSDLISANGKNIVEAGAGDDIVTVSGGSIIVYNYGDGNDTIYSFQSKTDNNSEIIFKNVNSTDVVKSVVYSETTGLSLVISVSDGGSITIPNFYSSYFIPNADVVNTEANVEFFVKENGIGQITFADTVWTMDDLRSFKLDSKEYGDFIAGVYGNMDNRPIENLGMLNANNDMTGSDYNDNIRGGMYDDTVNAGSGNDTIKTYGGHDVITGGTGNDRIMVGVGSYDINFNKGDGNDLIKSEVSLNENQSLFNINPGQNSTLIIGDDFSAKDVFLTKGDVLDTDLRINFAGSTDSIVLSNFLLTLEQDYSESGETVKYIQFADGEKIDLKNFINSNKEYFYNDNLFANSAIALKEQVADSMTISESITLYGSPVKISVSEDYVIQQANKLVSDGQTTHLGVVAKNDSLVFNGSMASEDITGSSSDDIINTAGGSDIIHTGGGNDFVTAGHGNDVVYIESDSSVVFGGDGNDSFFIDSGKQFVSGGFGVDTYNYSGGDLTIVYQQGSEDSSNDVIKILDQSVSLDSIEIVGSYNVTDDLVLKISSDEKQSFVGTITIKDFASLITSDNGSFKVPELEFANGLKISLAAMSNTVFPEGDTSQFQLPDSKIIGQAIVDYENATRIEGANKDDLILGGEGNDIIINNGGNDAIDGGLGDDRIYVSTGNNNIWGGAGNDTIVIDKEKDFIDNIDTGSGFNNVVFDGDINNSTIIQNKSDIVISSSDVISFTVFNESDLAFFKQSSNLVVYNQEHDRTLVVNNFFDENYNKVKGFVFADGTNLTNIEIQALSTMISDPVTDVVMNGSSDILSTSKNEDFHYTASSGVVAIFENESSSKDIITLDSLATKADLSLERVIANSGDHLMIKLGGDDGIILVDYFNNSSNIDTIKLSDGSLISINSLIIEQDPSIRVGSELDDVFIAKSDKDVNYSGLDGQDTLTSLGGNDILDGGAGNDTISGGLGNNTIIGGADNDTLIQGNGFDVFVFDSNFGNDTIIQSDNAQNGTIKFINSVTAKDLVINPSYNDSLSIMTPDGSTIYLDGYFSRGNNIDKLVFADGSEVSLKSILPTEEDYVGTTKNDIKTVSDFHYANFQGGSGNDILTGGNYNDNLDGGIGNDTLDGGAGDDTLIGGAGNDTLIGGSGKNSMMGGAGNDTYIIASTWDDGSEYGAFENANEGTDLVKTYVNTRLSYNVENLTAMGTESIGATGNDLNNVMVANDSGDTFYGFAGNDTLTGGKGDDYLDGGDGNDIITGGLGNNTLVGGLGNDTYIVSSSTDIIVENLNEGTDTVKSSVDFKIADNIENLTLTASNLIGEGNDLNNTIIATSGNNTLIGNGGNDTLTSGTGDDTMMGGIGNDTYNVNSIDDIVIENLNEGTDTVKSTINYSLGANIENLTLMGTANLSGIGNELNNVLTSNAGVNTLIGGLGNDTYVLNNSLDVVVENLNEGTDTVKASFDYTLGANFENLTLSGTGDFNGTGNEFNNVITGNAGNNTLYGLGGNDALTGGTGNDNLYGGNGNDTLNGGTGVNLLVGGDGNDTYTVTSVDDTVIENLNEGLDTVKSSISYTLGDNVENLTLTGTTGGLVGTGNSLDNSITASANGDSLFGLAGNDKLTGGNGNDSLDGGVGNDTLSSGAGNDVLVGGQGNDSLTGGIGSDVYKFGLGDGQDTINNTTIDTSPDRIDQLAFDNNVNADQLWFQKSGNNLVISVLNTTDKITVTNWFTNANNHLQDIMSGDGMHLSDTDVANLVQTMSTMQKPVDGHVTGPALDIWHH